jgi:putative sigma-54 modulation protein
MTADEAVMQLEMEGSRFFIFLNSNTNQINVAYKKEHGAFVVIEPQV